jgi:atypical dual specificity phosphatase
VVPESPSQASWSCSLAITAPFTMYQERFVNDMNFHPDFSDPELQRSPSQAAGAVHWPSSPCKERFVNDNHPDFSDPELQRCAPRSSASGIRESLDSCSSMSRENWHGKFYKGSGEPVRSLRLTTKLRDFHKFAKVGN